MTRKRTDISATAALPQRGNGPSMGRRTVLGAAIAAGASLALPRTVFASASPLTPAQRRILDVAKTQMDRAGDVLWHRDMAGIAITIDYGQRDLKFEDSPVPRELACCCSVRLDAVLECLSVC